MSARIRDYIRRNVLGLVAIFIALNAGAYAATVAPPNSVVSSSIKDGQVKTPDLGPSAATSPKIATGAVTSPKLKAFAVTHPKLAANAVGPANVADNSLTGADINESTLGIVPNANQLDGLDSTAFLGATATASGDLAGNYPSPTIAGGAVTSNKLAPDAIPADGPGSEGSTKLATNSVSFEEIALDAVHDSNLRGDAAGASGWVDATGALVAARSKHVTGARKIATGDYCIDTADSIDLSGATLVATPNFSQDSTSAGTDTTTQVEWVSSNAGCNSTEFEVQTFKVALDDADQVTAADAGFTFYIR